ADTPRRIAELHTALAAKDAPLLTRAAHSIKGASGNFGALPLAAVAQAIEQHGKASAFAEAGAKLPALEAEFARVQAALKEIPTGN
ncbi:MAG: Hpt domain-containing protein, partial [Opitutales bacterium]